MAIMHVPKTTMNKNYSPIFWKNYIRLARHVLGMKTKTKAVAMQDAANQQFRLRIFSPDAGHHPASGGLVDDISHAGASSGTMPVAL